MRVLVETSGRASIKATIKFYVEHNADKISAEPRNDGRSIDNSQVRQERSIRHRHMGASSAAGDREQFLISFGRRSHQNQDALLILLK
jgi:hypothetical protein